MLLLVIEASSGLRVNGGKQSFSHQGGPLNSRIGKYTLECRVENIPTTYLGMPLGSKHKAVEIWDNIVEKNRGKKLARWKAQYLSLGGRLILINSVLDSLITYVISPSLPKL